MSKVSGTAVAVDATAAAVPASAAGDPYVPRTAPKVTGYRVFAKVFDPRVFGQTIGIVVPKNI